jgi:hypothetical protein
MRSRAQQKLASADSRSPKDRANKSPANEIETKPGLPPDVSVVGDPPLLVWKPRGILNENAINRIIVFIGQQEAASHAPIHRFTDLSQLDAVDLNFRYVFHVALFRRLAVTRYAAMKSAFLTGGPDSVHYTKLHALLTDRSPLQVKLFAKREDAAKWLQVPVELLT